ncbi:MAG: AAA family ATPase [Pseudomonadota bacterium]
MADPELETWKVPDVDDDRAFSLEEDPTFGAGDLEGAPPADDADPSWTTIAAEAFESAGRSGGDQPIPRVTINAFCDRPDVATAIEAAAGDRRLAKAIVQVAAGGIEAALTSLASQASPNLIIIDTTAPASALLRGLDRLAQIVDEGTKVVIVGGANDIALYRELMRRGVSEYMIAPIQPLQLIQSISALYVNPDKPFVGRVAAVIGAKGGVGASTLAHNLAWCIAERYGANSTLMDLDLPFGTVGLDFNQDQTQGVVEALLAPERVDEVFLDRLLMRQTERLTLFTAPATLEREFELDPTAYETVIDRVRRAVPFVLLDLPHAWNSWLKQTVLGADDVVIVTTPDLAGLRNCKNLLDMVRASRPHDAPPTIALNMVGVPKRPEIPVKDFGEALGATPGFVIPFEPAIFGAAANNGQMVVEMAPESRSGLAIDQLAQALCGREPVAHKKSSMLDKIPAFLKR